MLVWPSADDPAWTRAPEALGGCRRRARPRRARGRARRRRPDRATGRRRQLRPRTPLRRALAVRSRGAPRDAGRPARVAPRRPAPALAPCARQRRELRAVARVLRRAAGARSPRARARHPLRQPLLLLAR